MFLTPNNLGGVLNKAFYWSHIFYSIFILVWNIKKSHEDGSNKEMGSS